VLPAVLAAMIAVPPIGTRGEAREGLVVRDVVRSGRWILPERNGTLASKPPLYHWIAAAIALPVGLSDAVVRLPSALAAIAVALLTGHLGRTMGGARRGWLAVGALLGCHRFWWAASEARVDMLFAACTTLSLAGFWSWYQTGTPAGQRAYYLGAAAAVLTKGPAGLILPVLVVVAFLAWQGDLRRLRPLCSLRLLVLAVVPVALWYGLAWHTGGPAFIRRQILFENVDRFLGHGAFARARWHRPLKLVGGFLVVLLPWNLALASRLRADDEDDRRATRFLHVWWIVILAFFSAAASKRIAYLLPLYPPVVLLAARWLDRRSAPSRPWLPTALLLLALVIAAATHYARLAAARANALIPFAARVVEIVPREAPLAAALRLSENDLLVLAYLLDRPLARARAQCTPGAAWLVPASTPALPDGAMRLATASRPGGGITLAVCRGGEG
jgi:4-amino-4-deoxy-L-arabinose transferase-like glycosyltransferase